MDLQQIEALARLIRQSDLTALEVSEGAMRIRLERERTAANTTPAIPVQPGGGAGNSWCSRTLLRR